MEELAGLLKEKMNPGHQETENKACGQKTACMKWADSRRRIPARPFFLSCKTIKSVYNDYINQKKRGVFHGETESGRE